MLPFVSTFLPLAKRDKDETDPRYGGHLTHCTIVVHSSKTKLDLGFSLSLYLGLRHHLAPIS